MKWVTRRGIRVNRAATASVRFAGAVGQVALGLSLGIGAGMKIAYEVTLFAAFRRIEPPEQV
jgi:hypothetical protein